MIIENKFATFWTEKGILYFEYKEDVKIHMPAAVRIVKDRLKLHRGKPYPILCDIGGIADIDLHSRRYFALEGSTLIKAVALLCITPLSNSFSDIYISGNSPAIPTRIFNIREEAVEFLSSFIH